ncbi:MAG: EI24 domain-containing protein [Pseudomonadota bacterium]
MALIGDFLRAIGQIPDRRFLIVFLKALGLTIALLVGMTAGAGWLASFIPTDLGEWWLIGQVELPSLGLQTLAIGAVLFASSFLMIPVAAMFVGLFLDEIADAVEAKHYPDLPEPRRSGLVTDLLKSVRFAAVVIVLNILALVFYLLSGPLAPAVFVALNGYLLGREYFEMVAARHLPTGEATILRKRNFWRTWLAGILMAIPLVIPVMNLIVPVLGVATITHQFHRRWHAARAV